MYNDEITFDPVCGMEVRTNFKNNNELTINYKNNTYYFCSIFCSETFKANPEFFINQLKSQYKSNFDEDEDDDRR